MNIQNAIQTAFSRELAGRIADLSFPNSFLQSADIIAIESYRNSKSCLSDLSNPENFFGIEGDPLNWLIFFEENLFLKLLPVYMLVALTPNRVESENLRGFLLGYLSASKHSSDAQLSIMNHIFQNLSPTQLSAVEEFTSIYE